jgi:uncharacterized protein DUF3854
MSFAEIYLRERGITEQTIRSYGLELDAFLANKKARTRLGRSLAGYGVAEIIWFPLYDQGGKLISYIARILPSITGLPKFLSPAGSDGPPYIPSGVYNLKHGLPIIVTEGPVKALACVQAGFAAIGLNGVWGASLKNAAGLYVIRADLGAALEWRGRKVYVAFDVDAESNPDVRQALVRLFLVLSAQGAEVFRMSWGLER